jgi:hypothetical protein
MILKAIISCVVLAAGLAICSANASGSVHEEAIASASTLKPTPSQYPNGSANWCCDSAGDLRCRIPRFPVTPWGEICWCPGPAGGYGVACYGP